MARHEFTLEQATKSLSANLVQNVEDAFYEELRPNIERIARNAARKLAQSLKGYIYHERNFDAFDEPTIVLKFNSEEIKF